MQIGAVAENNTGFTVIETVTEITRIQQRIARDFERASAEAAATENSGGASSLTMVPWALAAMESPTAQ